MEPNAALVRANRHAVLDAVAAVDLHAAVVVYPGHAEHDDALGLHQALQQSVLGVAGVFCNKGPQAFHHFGDCLQKLGLPRVALGDVRKEAACRRVFHVSRDFLNQRRWAGNGALQHRIMSKSYTSMPMSLHNGGECGD